MVATTAPARRRPVRRDIRRLGIVNRGEPARRALTAVAELNAAGHGPRITTIVLYTEPDEQAWFVREADEAVSLGPATFVDPTDGRVKSRYLDELAVVDALIEASVDAVWVGWGFVAEQASFAQRCEEAGILFVGPDSATIRRLGDKVAAKRLAERAGVPVVPWSGGPVDDRDAPEHAARLGYPLLVKASAGGGGRGIRVATEPTELADALASARAEAKHAFGDPTVFLERLVPAARHVEVQVLADAHGTTWAVGVRECTIQRRHQKVIEESGCAVLDAATDRAIRDAAVRVAQAAGYRNAGTVEFLVDPGGRGFQFMEVNARLQVEHPATEATTGVDLVKSQLAIARGERLTGRPPRTHGYAVEARLCAEDPERGFAPAPGRVRDLSIPEGPGIRVDAGVRAGDVVAPEFDSMIAKVIAWGRDRDEAIARLRRALGQTTVVIEGGTTTRSFLLWLLGTPEVRDGRFDTRWLDRLTATGAHLPPPDPVALLVAAVESYDADQAAEQAAFHQRAGRGGPEAAGEVGHRCRLRYRGARHDLWVYRTGPRTYRIDSGTDLADVMVERWPGHQRRVDVGGRRHRVVTVVEEPIVRVDVDGVAHTVTRDDGGLVRCGSPAFVVAVLVRPGDTVAEGDSLVVVESMKMETTVTAPFGGEVAEVSVQVNSQLDAGAPLLRIRSDVDIAVARPAGVSLAGLAARPAPGTPPCEHVYAVLRGYLLGYDLDPATQRATLTRQRRLGQVTPPADAGLMRCEDGLLDLFADVASLYRPRSGADPEEPPYDTQEHLLSYLQWLDPQRAGLPDRYTERLERALRRYGVCGLARTPRLEEAVVWMFRSFRRVAEMVGPVTAILERRLRHRDDLVHLADDDMRARLGRLVTATQGRHQIVADLARDVRFHYLDEPMLTAAVRREYEARQQDLAALADPLDRRARARHVQRLVACPQPLRPLLLARWPQAAGDDPTGFLRRALLEVHLRWHYRTRDLRRVATTGDGGWTLASADYDHVDGTTKRIHVVVAYAPLGDLPALSRQVAGHLRHAGRGRGIVLDVTAWRDGPLDPETLGDEVVALLRDCDFGRPLWRLDLTVSAGPTDPPRHLTFRQREDGPFVEEPFYRDLHPMLAKRLELWRLSSFRLDRLPAPEGVYLFHGVARANPADHRLFGLAEVRDLTRVDNGLVRYPGLELTGTRVLAALRDALAGFAPDERPALNRIVLYVAPPWELPAQVWSALARSLAPLAVGAGLQKVVLRVAIPRADGTLRDSVLHVEGLGDGGVTVRDRPPSAEPVRVLTPYRQKVLRATRFGVPYPYEIVRLLTPPPGALARFPTGTFIEYDLDDGGELSPVDRPYGSNQANVVVGVLRNPTATVPEGMARVVLLGDPTRGLGNLAEPECRRIIAALDLAERLRVPVEWFALSSGARIAMDSGTENMDWIAAVLRRLVEYTQAGGEVNVVVTGINVGAQPYWNAEATMLMHTRGILVMTPTSAMVLTGKQALDFSGGVSAEDNFGIGGFDRIMGPNGQGQYWAATLEAACEILLRHYEYTYVVAGERYPRRAATADPVDRDVRTSPHRPLVDTDMTVVGDVFSAEHNRERKRPFDMRSVMRAVTDTDSRPLERWGSWRGAETAIVWDARIGGLPVCLLGIESHTVPRRGFVPAGGPTSWSSGTLFPQSSRKVARAVNAASGNRPLVVLANLSGFDGSPESMRRWQLEYGAEIGRAVTNFRGPIVFVVVSRYHGGAFVVFSKALNDRMEIAAVEGSYASVIGGAPAAATVFARDVKGRTQADARVREATRRLKEAGSDPAAAGLRAHLVAITAEIRSEKLGEVADEFDAVHTVRRARAVGSVDHIIPAARLRPYLVDALERGMAVDAPGGQRANGRVSQEARGTAVASAVGSSRATGGGAVRVDATVTTKRPSRRHHPGSTAPSAQRTVSGDQPPSAG
jgi:acetyl/propionyl-CoA carboxylase alpha subunit/acetyl-CoA carboxylase carboxyltransferase component